MRRVYFDMSINGTQLDTAERQSGLRLGREVVVDSPSMHLQERAFRLPGKRMDEVISGRLCTRQCRT
jgi:hypothetical protein